ncbi:MAG: LTA synthase family protein [bacterium]|nr:LTA synthase family protein [bacterium]
MTFQWPAFTRAGEAFSDELGIAIVADLVPVALGVGLLWIAARLGDELPFALIAGVALSIVVAVLGAISFSLVAPASDSNTPRVAPDAAPDVLFVVVDAYARADWLDQEFGFDNREFLVQLESRGFAIASAATPNYGYTYASVSTMLNLDYVFEPGVVSDAERTQMRAALTGATGLLPLFAAAGYETAYIENAWGGSQCGSAIDWCIRDGIGERALWNLGQMTILAPVIKALRPDPFNALSVSRLEGLGDAVTSPAAGGRPRFTFAHFLLPHTPTLLNADCTRRDRSDITRWGGERGPLLAARRDGYVQQTICVNRLLVEALDTFLAEHPDGIVLITGDHGPGSTLDPNLPLENLAADTIEERMKTLSAYRMPGCEGSFRQDLTPVNGARLIANCALASDLDSLPDLNYWADLDGEGVVTDLTARLGG